MASKSSSRVLPWILAVICFIAVMLLSAMVFLPKLDIFGLETRARSAEVVNTVTGIQEVALVALGIEGIEGRSSTGTFEVPFTEIDGPLLGTNRARYMKFEFTAKLGLDGSTVEIDRAGEDGFRITIPEFKVIGLSNPRSETLVEDNGVLSWLTPEINESDITNHVYSDEEVNEYLDKYEVLLQEQAENFYNGIVKSVAPEATLEFRYLS